MSEKEYKEFLKNYLEKIIDVQMETFIRLCIIHKGCINKDLVVCVGDMPDEQIAFHVGALGTLATMAKGVDMDKSRLNHLIGLINNLASMVNLPAFKFKE